MTQAPKERLSKQSLVSIELDGGLVPAGPGKRGGWGLLTPNPSSRSGGGGRWQAVGFPAID